MPSNSPPPAATRLRRAAAAGDSAPGGRSTGTPQRMRCPVGVVSVTSTDSSASASGRAPGGTAPPGGGSASVYCGPGEGYSGIALEKITLSAVVGGGGEGGRWWWLPLRRQQRWRQQWQWRGAAGSAGRGTGTMPKTWSLSAPAANRHRQADEGQRRQRDSEVAGPRTPQRWAGRQGTSAAPSAPSLLMDQTDRGLHTMVPSDTSCKLCCSMEVSVH